MSDVSVVFQLRVNGIEVVIKGQKARKAMVFGINGVLEPVRRNCDEIRRNYFLVSHLVLVIIILIIKIIVLVIMMTVIMIMIMMMMIMMMMIMMMMMMMITIMIIK